MTEKGWTECTLEYLTPTGEWSILATHDLLHPERYPGRLSEAGKVGRAVEVGGQNRIWVSDNVPADPSCLVATTEGGPVPWRLPDPSKDACQHCGVYHPTMPQDGQCLL